MSLSSLWLEQMPLVLASASAIRREILEKAGIPLEIQPSAIDERALESSLGTADSAGRARYLAKEKARAVSRLFPGRLVLGADQTLELTGHDLHKPSTRQAAAATLRALSGQVHSLHSGLALAKTGEILWHHVETATLHTRILENAFIERYLDAAGDAVMTSVGAYQVEALGAHLFEKIDGDHSTILGLPIFPLLRFLQKQGFVAA